MKQYCQSDLVNDLALIFPDFSAYWEKDIEDDEQPPLSLHYVYMSLMPFLKKAQPTQSSGSSLPTILVVQLPREAIRRMLPIHACSSTFTK
jgi:hypothetical protein